MKLGHYPPLFLVDDDNAPDEYENKANKEVNGTYVHHYSKKNEVPKKITRVSALVKHFL